MSVKEKYASQGRRREPVSNDKQNKFDFKDVENLRNYITERGKILPRRITGASFNVQRKLKQAIKRARHMALVPFVAEE